MVRSIANTMSSEGIVPEIFMACLTIFSLLNFTKFEWSVIEPATVPTLKFINTTKDERGLTLAIEALANMIEERKSEQIKAVVETNNLNRFVELL